MSSAPAGGGGGGGGGGNAGGSAVGGALSLMGCVREASPPPQDHHHHHHHHMSLGEFGTQQRSVDTLPKEPKKRRFHPLRGLRRIFRRKSRGAADARLGSRNGERDGDLINRDREEVTLRHPAGRPEEARSRSASELLTDSCDRESVFLRRSGVEESFAKLRGGPGQLSVSHDSVFPGEVPHTRPLSSLDPLATLERRQTKASDEGVHKDYNSRIPHGNRISLRVLEQIKTVIENRNQLASTTSNDTNHTSHNRFTHVEKHERNVDETFNRVTRNSEDATDRESTTPKEDLPELECVSLSHTAAHHRISVRPKNRRPPRRTGGGGGSVSASSTITTITESQDVADSLEVAPPVVASSPMEVKSSNSRKSSMRLSRNSDIFDELEAKLPARKPSSMASLSPDSLDSTNANTSQRNGHQEVANETEETSMEIRPVARKASNRISKGSEIYDELEAKLPRRRSSSSRLSKSPDSLESGSPASLGKSIEGFDKLIEQHHRDEDVSRNRKLSNFASKSSEGFEKLDEDVELRPSSRRTTTRQMSKSIEGFDKLSEDQETRLPRRSGHQSKSNEDSLKSADSLDAIETVISDDSIERRRSSFELRPRKIPVKLMSMSNENFDTLDHTADDLAIRQELTKKRSSASDVNLSRGRRYSKLMSKSTESFDPIETMTKMGQSHRASIELDKNSWRSSKRTNFSSESSDNLELDDSRLENRRSRRPSKRNTSTSIVDIFPFDHSHTDDDDRLNGHVPNDNRDRKSSRLKKSSESSELGSTDTLDSERRNNKSSDSTETIDSLEKDNEQDSRDEDITDNAQDKRDKSDSWSGRMTDVETANGDEETNRQIVTPGEKTYWRQTSDSKENIDIHQLLAITIVTRMSDNGNNQRNNSAGYPKKKHQQQQQIASPPTSPIVQQDDNKLIFNNLLTSKNDEDLQNMLNGNISEVSTDTKSFKEKLIMFEKLGK